MLYDLDRIEHFVMKAPFNSIWEIVGGQGSLWPPFPVTPTLPKFPRVFKFLGHKSLRHIPNIIILTLKLHVRKIATTLIFYLSERKEKYIIGYTFHVNNEKVI